MTRVPRQVVGAGGVQVVDDRTTTYSALVVGRVVDVHGTPLPDVRVVCDRVGTHVRRVAGGLFVVSGVASRVLPDLATAADSLTLRLAGHRRPLLSIVVPLPQGTALPVLRGDVYLPAGAASVSGQVRRLDLTRAPIADATVRAVADAAVPGLHPLALRTAVRGDHSAGTTTLRAATVTSLAAATSVPEGARPGQTVLDLVSNAGVAAGVVLRLNSGAGEHYGLVREVMDGLVILTAPLSAGVPTGGPAEAVSITATGPNRTLARDALVGDGLLTLDADLTAEVVEIVDGTTREVHAVGARSGPDGFFRLSGIRALPVVAFKATASGLSGSQPASVRSLDEGTTNHVDLDVQP
jgi:hypothetical protein